MISQHLFGRMILSVKSATLGLRRRRGRVAPLCHELIELALVLGHAQTLQKFTEFALFVLQSPQRLGAVFVESVVAACGPRPAARTKALHLGPHAFHLFLPMVVAMSAPAAHSSAPQGEGEDRKAYGPPEDEPQHHEDDPSRMPKPKRPVITWVSPFMASCRTAHRSPPVLKGEVGEC